MRRNPPARTPDGSRSRPLRRTRPGRSGKAPRTGHAWPIHGLLHRLHLEDPIARDQLLRLVKRPINDGAASPGELHTPPLSAREKPREIDKHSGLFELIVVPAHRGEQVLARHCTRFRIPLDHQHHPHVMPPPWTSSPASSTSGEPGREALTTFSRTAPTTPYPAAPTGHVMNLDLRRRIRQDWLDTLH
jgi:hypothetical protein